MKIILASGSPRRLTLLRATGLDVTPIEPRVQELSDIPNKEPKDLAEHNARIKAEAIFNAYGMFGSDAIIGADSIVVLDKTIFGKPKNVDEAFATLSLLNGKKHQIITSYCILVSPEKMHLKSVFSNITFRDLSEFEIRSYIASGECMDKAGAYAVQGAGAGLIDEVSGSISNIIGLPIKELLCDLRKFTERTS